MYYFMTFFRTIIMDGVSPEPTQYLMCLLSALIVLLLGGLFFRKTQDQFILHI